MSVSELFIDKYRPSSFEEIKHNKDVKKNLQVLSDEKEMPHMIIYGSRESGKKTFAMMYLREKFGDSVFSVKKRTETVKLPNNKEVDYDMIYSNYHYFIDLSNSDVYDRQILHSFMKKYAGTKSILCPYHTIILYNADKLTNEAQQSIIRTLERNIRSYRFIFLVNNDCNLIKAMQSRCAQIRLVKPSFNEVESILRDIVELEKLDRTVFTDNVLAKIVEHSDRRISKSINILEWLSTKSRSQDITKKTDEEILKHCLIDMSVSDLIDMLFKSSDFNVIILAREKMQKMLVHCIEPETVLLLMFKEIMKRIPDGYIKYKKQVIENTDKYEASLAKRSKAIYHLEGYYISLLIIIKEIQQKNSMKNPNSSSKKNSKTKNSSEVSS